MMNVLCVYFPGRGGCLELFKAEVAGRAECHEGQGIHRLTNRGRGLEQGRWGEMWGESEGRSSSLCFQPTPPRPLAA